MKWIESGGIKYAPAQVRRNNVIDLDNLRVDPRYYTEESSRRWYFVVDVGPGYLFQVVSMAYDSGWDSWDKNGEALRKYGSGEVEILLQKFVTTFDFDNFKPDWILND